MELYIVFAAVIIIGFLVLRLISSRRKKLSKLDKHYFKEEWEKVLDILKKDPSKAVMSADALLAEALRKLGYSGSMADMMIEAEPRLKDYNRLWIAHKFRNAVAHNVDIKLSRADGKTSVGIYRGAFKDLGVW